MFYVILSVVSLKNAGSQGGNDKFIVN